MELGGVRRSRRGSATQSVAQPGANAHPETSSASSHRGIARFAAAPARVDRIDRSEASTAAAPRQAAARPDAIIKTRRQAARGRRRRRSRRPDRGAASGRALHGDRPRQTRSRRKVRRPGRKAASSACSATTTASSRTCRTRGKQARGSFRRAHRALHHRTERGGDRMAGGVRHLPRFPQILPDHSGCTSRAKAGTPYAASLTRPTHGQGDQRALSNRGGGAEHLAPRTPDGRGPDHSRQLHTTRRRAAGGYALDIDSQPTRRCPPQPSCSPRAA